MSNFRRQGTVSKASGPTHANSYAMKEVLVRYKTPIFVPELLTLPGDWVKPTLPSIRKFNYDYSLEHRVAEQARQKAVSIAAEASLKRQQIDALRDRHKKTVEGAANSADSAPPQPVMLHPLFPSSMDILTPTPAAPPPVISQSSPTVRERGVASTKAATGAQSAGSSSGEGDSSSSLIEDETQPAARLDQNVFKSLGNWSIKEFEGDVMDPFEIASLQAINDMEELQSVLQQTQLQPPSSTPAPASSSSSSSTVVGVQGSSSSTPVLSQSQVPAASHHSATAVQSSPILGTHVTSSTNYHLPSSSTVGPHPPQQASTSSSPGMALRTNVAAPSSADVAISNGGSAPLSSSSPLTQGNPFGTIAGPPTNPFQPTSVAMTSGSGTNPFQASEPIPNRVHFPMQVVAVSSSPDLRHPPQQQSTQEAPQRGSSEPGIGTLVDLGDESNARRPIPAPRASPKVQRSQVPIPSSSTVLQGGIHPVPKPRQGSPAPQPRHTHPAVAANIQPPPQSVSSGSNPGPTRGPPPPVAPKTNSPKTTPARTNRGSPNFTATHNHVTMGIPVLPVLPPPTSSSQATPPSEPPPAYKQQATPNKSSPPPPYSSPSLYQRHQAPSIPPPQVQPKTHAYTLPDPEASLTIEQRQQVMSIAGMGFPPQRVGRAILRFDGDQTKVLDFLFLVGELEEARYNGDSAETALKACKDKLDEAKTYLDKLGVYKEIGFREKQIHEAYLTAKGDWDKALDILTRDR